MDAQSKIISDLVAAIASDHSVETIILFGSRARNDAEKKSDIDIAVVAPSISERNWLELVDKVANLNTLLEIDLIRFDSASAELKTQIIKEGKTIYERT